MQASNDALHQFIGGKSRQEKTTIGCGNTNVGQFSKETAVYPLGTVVELRNAFVQYCYIVKRLKLKTEMDAASVIQEA
jgi:hypothetical protein